MQAGSGIALACLQSGGTATVIAKLGQFTVPGQIEPLALLIVVVVDTRQHLVGQQRIWAQDLVAAHLRGEVPVGLVVAGGKGLLQLAVDLSAHLRAEVVEVVVILVAHLGVVDAKTQAAIHQGGTVADVHQVAMAIGQASQTRIARAVLLVIR